MIGAETVSNQSYLLLQLIGGLIEGRYGLRAACSNLLVDLTHVFHVGLPRKILGHVLYE